MTYLVSPTVMSSGKMEYARNVPSDFILILIVFVKKSLILVQISTPNQANVWDAIQDMPLMKKRTV